MKINKLVTIMLLGIIGSFNQTLVSHAESNVTSTVSGEIISGEFSMSVPNDVSFSTKLSGQKQSIQIDDIQTSVTDYRGIDNGWQVIVKSPNFNQYQQHYQLKINNQFISDNSVIVYKNDKQSLIKDLSLSTSVELSADAKAGSYGGDLEWNLQPNIKNKIQE
ncbi:hypothetical protein [Enterococcus sp. CR-Ec1]|uniref:hypothetical protein n=1 Tax=Enterococcus sp. CR-Ec1 TaxID=2057791 RepID=UPI000C792B26|nr:hypothetical protein [Enterococcus sp. CR-Ec1]AUJ86523.1 hypothetical protein CXM95_14035 [Enterococcus sp. CR-Ec1]